MLNLTGTLASSPDPLLVPLDPSTLLASFVYSALAAGCVGLFFLALWSLTISDRRTRPSVRSRSLGRRGTDRLPG